MYGDVAVFLKKKKMKIVTVNLGKTFCSKTNAGTKTRVVTILLTIYITFEIHFMVLLKRLTKLVSDKLNRVCDFLYPCCVTLTINTFKTHVS